MKRILTIIAASATLAGATAPTAFAQSNEVTMLTGKVFRALRDCGIDGNVVDNLTMAQIAGITIAESTQEESEKCQRIEALVKG